MDTRADILARVRAAGAGRAPAPPPQAPEPSGPSGDLAARFADELRPLAATSSRAANEEELALRLGEVLRARGASSIVAWDSPLLERLSTAGPVADLNLRWTRPPIAEGGEPLSWRAACLQADAGITEVDYALADTGTLVVRAGVSQPRLTSLLPPMHVAIVAVERLLPDLGALLRATGGGRDSLTSCLTLITGPSRTADIEKKIVLGVHGPEQLHVILLG